MNKLYIYSFIFAILVISCGKAGVYIYRSDLNKPSGYQFNTKVNIRSDTICWVTNYQDSISYECKSISSLEQKIEYLERRRVVKVDSVFYIKKCVNSNKILQKYLNKVVSFGGDGG